MAVDLSVCQPAVLVVGRLGGGVAGGEVRVDVGALAGAASALSAAAGECRGVDVGTPMAAALTAMPMARTSMAAQVLVRELAAGLQAYASHIDTMSMNASSTSQAYLTVDDDAAVRLTHVSGVPWA